MVLLPTKIKWFLSNVNLQKKRGMYNLKYPLSFPKSLWYKKHVLSLLIFNIQYLTRFVIFNDQYSHLVYPNICIKHQPCENLDSIGRWSCKKMMKGKSPLLYMITVCFQLEIKGFWQEVFYHFCEKLPLSPKLRYFRGSR